MKSCKHKLVQMITCFCRCFYGFPDRIIIQLAWFHQRYDFKCFLHLQESLLKESHGYAILATSSICIKMSSNLVHLAFAS